MPILAAYPVVDEPAQIEDPFADSRTFAFRSLDGQTLLPCTGDEFIARWGITGLDVPDRELVEESIPGQDGTDLVDIKVGSRSYFLPLFLGSNSSHLQFLQNVARLRGLFNHRRVDYRTAGGTFDLVATSVLGERTLRSAYASGMNGDWAQDSMGSYWRGLGLNFLAARPNWAGESWSTPEIRRPSGARFLGVFPPRLSSSRALGADLVVPVPGDADSWAVVEATGPADYVNVLGPGLEVAVPDGLAAGEQLFIDTNPASRRVLFDGVGGDVAWGRISPSTIWSPLEPGDVVLNIDMGEATDQSLAVVSGVSQWETPW